MIVYLAGGINGNCKPLFTDFIRATEGAIPMDVYLAGLNGRRWCMDLYLAGTMDGNQGRFIDKHGDKLLNVGKDIDVAILESFYYADEWTEKMIPRLKYFLLDSGAFTFFSSGKHIDWNEYLDRYIAFINKNKVEHFFELDIDVLVGYEKVLEFRRKLERGTGRQCIPVWHKSRGKDEFIKMCDEYKYVAIGGIVSKEITQKEYVYFPWFLNEAHKRGVKVHGLGFTNLEGMRKYHFDSVDSTSWTTGNRFGAIYQFNGKTMVKHGKKEGQKLADSRAVAINNFNEWVKFQQYAKLHL